MVGLKILETKGMTSPATGLQLFGVTVSAMTGVVQSLNREDLSD